MLFVVLDDFLNDEVQEFLGKNRIQIGLICKGGQPCDLVRFAGWIRRRKVVFGFQYADGLGVLEPFTQRVNKDRIQPVNAVAVACQNFGGACCVIGHR